MLAASPLKLGMTTQLSFITLHKSQAQPPKRCPCMGMGGAPKFKDFWVWSVPFWYHVSGISLVPASLHWMTLSRRLFFQMQTEESLGVSEMGTYSELLWDIRVVILSVAGTALDGDQQSMFKADHSLCFDLHYHSFPGPLYINPWGS